ncbi:MAG: thiamine-phosphate pyrophosphorylase [Planctomycetota bacterium]|jgi:thiamine-phosphate pyrophosphorylase
MRFLRGLRRAFDAGLAAVILRERTLSDRAFGDLLGEVLASARSGDRWVGVHDRAHMVALGARPGMGSGIGVAKGLHLGFRSLSPAAARTVVGPAVALGLSTHAQDDPKDWRGADYLFHGPVNSTPSKIGWEEPVGIDGFECALERAQAVNAGPLWAIGGLHPSDASELRACGASGMVVLRGILGAPDPGAATDEYQSAWGNP